MSSKIVSCPICERKKLKVGIEPSKQVCPDCRRRVLLNVATLLRVEARLRALQLINSEQHEALIKRLDELIEKLN